MSLLVRAAPRADYPWIVDRTNCALTSDFSAVEAIEFRPGLDGGYLIRGMIAFCNTTRTAMQAHMAVDTPLVWRVLLVPALTHAFKHKRILLGVIPAGNVKSLTFTKHVGFRETYRLKDGWDEGEDLVFLELHRDECSWLNGRQKEAA